MVRFILNIETGKRRLDCGGAWHPTYPALGKRVGLRGASAQRRVGQIGCGWGLWEGEEAWACGCVEDREGGKCTAGG